MNNCAGVIIPKISLSLCVCVCGGGGGGGIGEREGDEGKFKGQLMKV